MNVLILGLWLPWSYYNAPCRTFHRSPSRWLGGCNCLQKSPRGVFSGQTTTLLGITFYSYITFYIFRQISVKITSWFKSSLVFIVVLVKVVQHIWLPQGNKCAYIIYSMTLTLGDWNELIDCRSSKVKKVARRRFRFYQKVPKGLTLVQLFGAGWVQKGVGGIFLKIRPHSCV